MTAEKSDPGSASGKKNIGVKVVIFTNTEPVDFGNVILMYGENLLVDSMVEKLKAAPEYSNYQDKIEIREYY